MADHVLGAFLLRFAPLRLRLALATFGIGLLITLLFLGNDKVIISPIFLTRFLPLFFVLVLCPLLDKVLLAAALCCLLPKNSFCLAVSLRLPLPGLNNLFFKSTAI